MNITFKKLFIFAGIFVLMISCGQKVKTEFPILRGLYLGLKPPRDVPQLFAPGIVSTDKNEHSPAIFSKDGNELFWSYYDQGEHVIMHMRQVDDCWTVPEKFVYGNDYKDGNPFFSPDWKRLIFHSGRRGLRDDGSMISPKLQSSIGPSVNVTVNPGTSFDSSANIFLSLRSRCNANCDSVILP